MVGWDGKIITVMIEYGYTTQVAERKIYSSQKRNQGVPNVADKRLRLKVAESKLSFE